MSSHVSIGEGLHPDREGRAERLAQTGKYDRKAIRARIALEQWLDEELVRLYNGSEHVEIDLDEVMEEDEEKREDLLKNLVSSAPNQADVAFFVKTLVKKLEEFKSLYVDLMSK